MIYSAHRTGFSLVEILVTLGIVGILTVLTLPRFQGSTDSALFQKDIAQVVGVIQQTQANAAAGNVSKCASKAYVVDYLQITTTANTLRIETKCKENTAQVLAPTPSIPIDTPTGIVITIKPDVSTISASTSPIRFWTTSNDAATISLTFKTYTCTLTLNTAGVVSKSAECP